MQQVLFLPPNLTITHPTDFSLYRISLYLRSKGIKTVLAYEGSVFGGLEAYFDEVIQLGKVVTLERLMSREWKSIIYRGWMQAYGLGGELCREYPGRVSVILKDWNFASEEEYAFLIGREAAVTDFKGIPNIFKYAKRILSHHDEDEHPKWACEHPKTPIDSRFVFFPELCDESRFVNFERTYDPKNISIIHAGSFYPTSGPRGFDNHKTMFDDAQYLTGNGINVHFVLPSGHYGEVMANERHAYDDCIYEHDNNPRYKILKGSSLDAAPIAGYDFGFITLRDMHKYPRFIGRACLSKFALYMEAGIPIMVPETLTLMAEWCDHYGIGIIYKNTQDGIEGALKAVTKNRYSELKKHVLKFREKFTYESWQVEKMI